MAPRSRNRCTPRETTTRPRSTSRIRPDGQAGRTHSRRGCPSPSRWDYGWRRGRAMSQTASCEPARTRALPLVSRCPTDCPAIACPMWRGTTDPGAGWASASPSRSARLLSTGICYIHAKQPTTRTETHERLVCPRSDPNPWDAPCWRRAASCALASAGASLMLRGGFRRRLSSFAKTTAGSVDLKISASGLFSSDSTLLRARIFDTPTGQACWLPPSATVTPHTLAA